MAKEHITMSRKEVDRLNVIQSVISKQLTQAPAAPCVTIGIDLVNLILCGGRGTTLLAMHPNAIVNPS